jgi:hypothetical protein
MCAMQLHGQEREVEDKDDDQQAAKKIMDLLVVDTQGQPIIKSTIQFGKVELDVSKLEEGQYKVIIYTPEKPIYSTFNISR